MYCPNCGKQSDESVKFCPECGQSLSGNTASPQQARTSAFGQSALFAQHRKRVLIAVLLNFLWSGAGCFYAKVPGKGIAYAFLAFIAWLIVVGASGAGSGGGVTFGSIALFGLFLGSCASSAGGVDVFNAKLLERLENGETNISALLRIHE